MIRRNITLGEGHYLWLAGEAERLGIGQSELLRRLIDQARAADPERSTAGHEKTMDIRPRRRPRTL